MGSKFKNQFTRRVERRHYTFERKELAHRFAAHDHVVGGQRALRFELSNSRFDAVKSLGFNRKRLLNVIATQKQHVAQLSGTDVGTQDVTHLIEIESQILQNQNAVEWGELSNRCSSDSPSEGRHAQV